MILDDEYITRDMLTNESYVGNILSNGRKILREKYKH